MAAVCRFIQRIPLLVFSAILTALMVYGIYAGSSLLVVATFYVIAFPIGFILFEED